MKNSNKAHFISSTNLVGVEHQLEKKLSQSVTNKASTFWDEIIKEVNRVAEEKNEYKIY